jgi:hypothetical protein
MDFEVADWYSKILVCTGFTLCTNNELLILVRLSFDRLIFRVTKLQQDVLQAEERGDNIAKRVKDE